MDTGFKRDPAIKEIIDFRTGEVRLRSSVAGGFVLRKIADPNTTIESLISLARSAESFAQAVPYYFDLVQGAGPFRKRRNVIAGECTRKTNVALL